jgi:hypothetical protein
MSNQTDAVRVRETLLRDYGTDFGASDEQLDHVAKEMQAYVRQSGRRWSWTVLAAERVAKLARGPE